MARGRELLQGLKSFEKGKIVTAREAVQLINDGETVATTGFVGIGFPENVAVALEQRYVESSEKDLDGVDGNTRLSVSLQSRWISILPVPLNSSKMMSSILESGVHPGRWP